MSEEIKQNKVVTENFGGAGELKVGDLVEQIRTCQVISITHLQNNEAIVKLEIVKKGWKHR